MPPMFPICMSTTTRSGGIVAALGDDLGTGVDLADLDVGSVGHRRDLLAEVCGVAGHHDDGHEQQVTQPDRGRRAGRPPRRVPPGRGRRSRGGAPGRPGHGATWSTNAATDRPSTSATVRSRAWFSSERSRAGRPARPPVGAAETGSEGGVDPVDHQGGRLDAGLGQARRRSRPVSSIESGRGEVTSTYAVAGSARSSRTAPAREEKPSSIPSKAWKKSTASWTISAPATLAIVRSRAWVAIDSTRSETRVGARRARKSRFSRNRVSRRGASRRSRALRVGGVSTTTMSNCPALGELVELLHRHVLLGAREHAGQVLVDAVGPDGLGLGHRAPRSAPTRSSKVPLVSSISACRVPGNSPTTGRGRVGQRLHPESVGQPAGRVDRDDTGPPSDPGGLQRRWPPPRWSCRPRPGPAADHHLAVGGQRVDRSPSAAGHGPQHLGASRPMPAPSASASWRARPARCRRARRRERAAGGAAARGPAARSGSTGASWRCEGERRRRRPARPGRRAEAHPRRPGRLGGRGGAAWAAESRRSSPPPGRAGPPPGPPAGRRPRWSR